MCSGEKAKGFSWVNRWIDSVAFVGTPGVAQFARKLGLQEAFAKTLIPSNRRGGGATQFAAQVLQMQTKPPAQKKARYRYCIGPQFLSRL
jgi:hypothetical protein